MTELAAASRVKLKSHVYFGLVEDGILFDAGETSFVMKDRSAYPLVERLIALIDAGTPVESILERAPEKLAGFFRRLLATLAEHDMLLSVEADAPAADALAAHTPVNELRKFLEDRLSGRSVDEALRRWRDAHAVVVGDGRALDAAVRALAANGCARLTLVPERAPAAAFERLREAVQAEHALRIVVDDRAGDAETLEAADLLVYASDCADVGLAMRVEAAMRACGAPGAIGAVFDAHACVLPAASQGRPGVADLRCWLPPADAGAASLGPIALSLLGCVAAQAATCRFFDVEPKASRGQVAVVSPELEVDYRMIVASADGDGATVPFVHASKYEMPQDRQLQPFERIKLALEPWFDPLLGPFAVVADDRIEQVPILQYPLRVRSAVAGGDDRLAVGWGLEHADAVVRGLTLAVEALAQSFLTDGAHVAAGFDEETWKQRALAHAIAGSAGFAREQRWAWVDSAPSTNPQVGLLLRLLRFHVPDGIRLQMQWWPRGGACVVRVFRDGNALCGALAADAERALIEALGTACSAFQLDAVDMPRFVGGPPLPEPAAEAQAPDWREALEPTGDDPMRDAEFHLLTAPGFPPAVYCGYATLGAEATQR